MLLAAGDGMQAFHRGPEDEGLRGRYPGSMKIAAVGDLLLSGSLEEGRDSDSVFASLRNVFSTCDLVIGNLECTLDGGGEMISTEPRVIASPALIQAVARGGFDALSLANNHMFDCLESGFLQVKRTLRQYGIAGFGAGENLAEAAAPAIVVRKGMHIALLAAADESSGAAVWAGENSPGINPFNIDRMEDQVRRIRAHVDHVIVCLHWGRERMTIPSPMQVQQGRLLAEAGATMVIGHHPHVIAGAEMHAGAAIAYSLGNFVACDVPYVCGDELCWNRRERTGCLLLADLNADSLACIKQVATFDPGLAVRPDNSGFGRRCIERANKALQKGISLGRYRRSYFWINTVIPTFGHLRPSRLGSLRPRHVRNALLHALESARAQ